MPKQRNHQHHHARSERRTGRLELPQVHQYGYGGPGRPRITYPAGWIPKWQGAPALMLLGMLALIILALAAAMLLIHIFP